MSKMNRPLTFALLFVLLNAGLVSCSKKGGTTPPSNTTLLTAKAWKYSDAGIDPDGNGTIDQALPAGTLAACQTDFLLTFKTDKNGVLDEGPTKCNSTDPQTNAFTWDFANNETELTFSQNIISGFGGSTKIIELSDTKLVLSKSITLTGIPIPIGVTVFLVH